MQFLQYFTSDFSLNQNTSLGEFYKAENQKGGTTMGFLLLCESGGMK